MPSFSTASGVEFAKTDLVSNHVVFKDQESFLALLRNQDLPVHTFSSFIHEATHHWCFISPVGNALSFLYLSVAKKALHWLGTEDMSQVTEAFNDLFAFEIAVSWLRPLNEGLAQFAEYDVRLTGSAPLYSPPLLSTVNHLFNLPRRIENAPQDDSTSAYYSLMDSITEWRLSRQVIERKSELLLQPIDSQGSAYLLGYLTVKQLWKYAAQYYDELKDADVFLIFIRKLLFADYALIADILDRNLNPMHRGMRFGKALYDRMRVIQTGQFASVPWSEWEKVLSMGSSSGPSGRATYDVADPIPFLFVDSEEASEHGTRLYDLFSAEAIHLMDFPPPRVGKEAAERHNLPKNQLPDDWFSPTYFFDLLRQRYLMWLGEASATWEPIGPKAIRVMVEGEVVIDNFNLPSDTSDKRLIDMKLNLYVDPYELYLVATIGNDDDIVGLRHWGKISDFAKSKLERYRLDQRKIVRDTKIVHRVVTGYVEGTNFRNIVDKFWVDHGRALLDMTYSGFAFNLNDEVQSIFLQQGLADVLQNDPDLVRSVAAISLGASAEMSPEMLVAACRDFKLDPRGTIQKIKELWPHDDFPLAGVDDDGFLSSAL